MTTPDVAAAAASSTKAAVVVAGGFSTNTGTPAVIAAAAIWCHRDAEALATLTAARAAAGEWIRYYRLARDITLELCERAGSRRSALLDRMVEHLSLVPTG